MNYLSSVNGMIKGIIEKGAKGGLKKAGEATVKILGTYADVTPMSEAGPLPPSPTAQEANAQEQAPAPPAPAPNAAVQLQEAVFGAGVVEALEPWASLLHAMLAHLPLLGGLTMPIVLGLLCSIFTLGALRLALAVLRFFESAGREPEDVFAWLAHHVFRVVHVPSSMVEALMTYAFVLLVSKAINRVAPGLPGPPMSHNGQKTPSRRGISASPEDGGSLSGVKYDGYNTAMAKAKIDLENNHSKGKETLDAINNRSEVALRTIQKGLVRVAAPFTPKEGGGKAHKAHRTHRNHHRPGHRANKAKVAGSSGDHRDIHNHRNSHAAHRFPGVFLTEGPPRSSNGDTNASEGANGSESYDGSEGHVMLPQGYNPPDLPAALRGQTYVEVLYENQRLQPFRGWGHTWPGHFLPTDRAMRWSRCDADGNDVDASQELEEVAPKLPEGWRWVEAEWQLDLSGVLSDSTDNEGWSYGLDFPWVVYPFAPGTGRK